MRSRFLMLLGGLALFAVSSTASAQAAQAASGQATASALSQCYDCAYSGALGGYACVPVQAGTSHGPGYHTCLDGGSTFCTMSEGCSPQLTFNSVNLRPDGSVTGSLDALETATRDGRTYVRACEGKIIARDYSAKAGSELRRITSSLVL